MFDFNVAVLTGLLLIAFDLDTVKLLMGIFVSHLLQLPENADLIIVL